MVNSRQIMRDAEEMAEDAIFESGELPRGARLERASQLIAEILLIGQSRTKTREEYARWRRCVRRAAVFIARNGQPLSGARLQQMTESQFYQ